MAELTRRGFAARLASVTTAGLIAAPATAQEEAKAGLEDDAPPEVAAPPVLAFEDHQLAALKDRYPAPHLTDEHYAGIRAGLAHNRATGLRLREFPLPFDVEPAFVFRAWRAD